MNVPPDNPGASTITMRTRILATALVAALLLGIVATAILAAAPRA